MAERLALGRQGVKEGDSRHLIPALTAIAGNFVDGYVLWLIGPVLAQLQGPLHLDPWWTGAIGSATLAGIFCGSLLFGPLADRFGRRIFFRLAPWAMALLSLAQFWAGSAEALVLIRMLLGMAIGAEYAVAPSYIVEIVPERQRGVYLSALMLAWMLGYMTAVATIFVVDGTQPDMWRTLLASSAVPALLVALFRLPAQETPGWLARQGSASARRSRQETLTALFRPGVRGRLAVGCLFFVCQAAPSFAIYTFFPQFLAAAGVGDANLKAGITYGLLMIGTLAGMALVSRFSRRAFLIGSFGMLVCCAAALALLAATHSPLGAALLFPIIALFALVFSAAATLQSVYPTELFPTEVRASGIGFVMAASRVGAVASTFAFPAVLAGLGVAGVMTAAGAILFIGFVTMLLWAPETRNAPGRQ